MTNGRRLLRPSRGRRRKGEAKRVWHLSLKWSAFKRQHLRPNPELAVELDVGRMELIRACGSDDRWRARLKPPRSSAPGIMWSGGYVERLPCSGTGRPRGDCST